MKTVRSHLTSWRSLWSGLKKWTLDIFFEIITICIRGENDACECYIGLYRDRGQKLYYDEEQTDESGPVRNEKVFTPVEKVYVAS